MDLVFLAASILMFALMVGMTIGCAKLGARK